jgi:hypothetical protein
MKPPIQLAIVRTEGSPPLKRPDLAAVRRDARKMPYAPLLRRVFSQNALTNGRLSSFSSSIKSKELALSTRAGALSASLGELGISPAPEQEVPPEVVIEVPADMLTISSGMRSAVDSGRICPKHALEKFAEPISKMATVSRLRAKAVFTDSLAAEVGEMSGSKPAPELGEKIPGFFSRMVPGGLALSGAASLAVSLFEGGILMPALAFAFMLGGSALAAFVKMRRERRMAVDILSSIEERLHMIGRMEEAADSELAILSEIYDNLGRVVDFLKGATKPPEGKRTLH